MPVIDKALILDTLHIMKSVENMNREKHVYLKVGHAGYNAIDFCENKLIFANNTNDVTINGKSLVVNSVSFINNKSVTGFSIINETGIINIENNSNATDCITIKSSYSAVDKGDILISKVTPNGDSYIRLGYEQISSTDKVYGIIINAVNTLYMYGLDDFRLSTGGVGSIDTVGNLNITAPTTNITGEVEVSKRVKLGISGTMAANNQYAITGGVAYTYVTDELKKYLPLSGGTLTGQLIVNTGNHNEPAIKVINSVWEDGIYLESSGSIANNNKYVPNGGAVFKYVTDKLKEYLPLSGGTLTGDLIIEKNLYARGSSSLETVTVGTSIGIWGPITLDGNSFGTSLPTNPSNYQLFFLLV